MINHEPVILAEHPDVQAFNEASVDYGKKLNPHDLLNEAVVQRNHLLAKLNMVPQSAFISQLTGSPYTLESFLQEMFVDHDRHHMDQIMHYLQTSDDDISS